MKYLLSLLVVLFLVTSCTRFCPPDVDNDDPNDSIPNPYVPKVCTDSTYFDTTLTLEEHDLPLFTVKLPKGSFSYVYSTEFENIPSAAFGYGCDTFDFQYGSLVMDAFDYTTNEYTLDLKKFKRNNFLMAIEKWRNPQTKLEGTVIIASKNDSINVSGGIVDPQYEFYLEKVIETFEPKH